MTDQDMRRLAVELVCFIQHGRWYNGKVDDKLADAVADRLMWGPCTAWFASDQAAYRAWKQAKLSGAAPLPRPLIAPGLPRPLNAPSLPRPLPAPGLPKPLPPLTLPRITK